MIQSDLLAGVGSKDEAGAAAGVDEGFEAVAFDLFAQVADVDVDDVAAGRRVHGVEGFPDVGAGDDLAGLEGEEFEEGVLARGEGDAFAPAGDAAGGCVDFEVFDLEEGVLHVVLAADEGADAGFELCEDAGFGDVVVGAGIEAADAVFGFILGGEDEDVGRDALGAEFAEKGEAVHVGKTEVEDDDFVLPGKCEAVAAGGVFGDIDGEARFFEDCGDKLLDGGVVLD